MTAKKRFVVPEKPGDAPPRKDNRPTKGILFVRGLTASVKNKFAGTCRTHGDTMTSVLEALMRLYNSKPEVVLHYLRRPKK